MKNRILVLMVLALTAGLSAIAEDGLCATVEIEIRQELTLERQAFDARMKINNGLIGIDLTEVQVVIHITDEEGDTVSSVDISNLNTATNALFFKQDPTFGGSINSLPGTVDGGTSGEMNWLLIPAIGASDDNPEGKIYYVGATLTYTLQGKEETVEVSPDYIFVKPMPYLELDYFLPGDVYGDDPMTTDAKEDIIPFPFGLRILNSGFGGVKEVNIDSGQPKIIANELGLKVDFSITGSSMHGDPVLPGLLLDFGDFESMQSKMGFWEMTSSLSGSFSNFTASITHSDELGGIVTSLINSTNVRTHIHIKDVIVDLPDRDRVVDFLTADDGGMVFESEDGLDTSVDFIEAAMPSAGNALTFRFTESSSNEFVYGKVSNPFEESKLLKEVVRSDGKRMHSSNAWLSKDKEGGTAWKYYFNVFDVNGSDYSYSVVYENLDAGNKAPEIYYIGPQVAYVGQPTVFLVMASDPDGTVPSLSTASALSGSDFPVLTGYNDLAVGRFEWTPTSGQVGSFSAKFTATDGALSADRTVPITVFATERPDLSYPEWWMSSGLIDTNRNPNDYGVANAGQLKNIASAAWDQFNLLPVGAPTIDYVSTNDFVAVNIGQVKATAVPFYDQMGMSNTYPWSVSAETANDYALANIGQVKAVFNFDPHKDSDADGLPDWWEKAYGSDATGMDPTASDDGDEHSNLYEYLNTLNPTVSD